MFGTQSSLRTKIFLSMICLILGASILIAAISIYQFNENAKDYHKERLDRKEDQIRASIDYELKKTSYEVTTRNIPLIFKDKIYELQDIHNMEILLFDLDGNLLKSSKARFYENPIDSISRLTLLGLKSAIGKRYVERFTEDGQKYRASYSYITDPYFKPLAILNLPYIEEDNLINRELKDFLIRLGEVYFFMMLIAIALAYVLSKHITRPLHTISETIKETRFDKANKRVNLPGTSDEIATVVRAYNQMIDELEESAAALAASERESAWREMAKQVAHEIKNPLTPMRLSVQSFERTFDPNLPDASQRIKEFSDTMIQQIDTLSSIASAFSTYAKMPAQQDETLDMNKITKLALEIFNESYVHYTPAPEHCAVKMDRTQYIRVVTNLVKNAIQSLENRPDPRIAVSVNLESHQAVLTVSDNGAGIAEAHKDKIFEPKFTTKSSGMGLGLAMVKNIVESSGGQISFTSEEGRGTVFRVLLERTTKDT